MERDDPEALKRVAQAAIARAAAAMSPRKLAAASAAAAAAIRREPLGLQIPGTPPDHRLDGAHLQWAAAVPMSSAESSHRHEYIMYSRSGAV